ncbi:MAG: C4-type zinc ribbon domain-containing protein [Planctomycetota bacterium]
MSVQEKLQELYLLDQQIRGLRSRVDAASRRQNAQRGKLDQLQRQEAELHEQLLTAKASAANLTTDAAAVEERIEKIRQVMTNVRSNKEYSALLVEVNTLKLHKTKIEDQELEHLSRVEDLQARTDEVAGKTAEQSKLVELAQKEVDSASAEIADQLGDLEKQRDEAAEPLEPDVLTLYRRLFDDYDGEALGEVEEQDRRRMEYTCGACFMSLPIQVVNAALTSKDKPVTCANCGRILYVSSQLKEALVPK